jgi:hypothetical protein
MNNLNIDEQFCRFGVLLGMSERATTQIFGCSLSGVLLVVLILNAVAG